MFGMETTSNNKEWILNTLRKKIRDASFMPSIRPRYNNESRLRGINSSVKVENSTGITNTITDKEISRNLVYNGKNKCNGFLKPL